MQKLVAAVRCKPCSYHDSPTMPSSPSGHAHTIVDLPTTAMRWQKSEEKPTAPHRRGHRHAGPLAEVPLLHLTHQMIKTPHRILDLQGNSSVGASPHPPPHTTPRTHHLKAHGGLTTPATGLFEDLGLLRRRGDLVPPSRSINFTFV